MKVIPREHPWKREIKRAIEESQRLPWRHITMSAKEAGSFGYTQSKLHELYEQGYSAVDIVRDNNEPRDYRSDHGGVIEITVEIWQIFREPGLGLRGNPIYTLNRFGYLTD